MRKIFVPFILVCLIVISCKKDFEGEANTQTAPDTYTVVDSVHRDPNNLLTTTVEAHWWAESKKGFIKGYEVSIDNQQTWTYTKDQKGVFLLSLPVGFDHGNLPIYVRAIDNLDQKDLTPAVMIFPVKNTPPTISFDYLTGRKTSTLPAFRYYWITQDVDGAQDIQSVELVMNDTTKTPLVITGSSFAATFVAQVNNNVFDTSFLVYPNTRTTAIPDKLNGVVYNQVNKIFIRSVDRVGSKSAWSVDSIMIKKPVSDFLMVNDYHSSKTSVQNFYATQLNNLGAPHNVYDVIQSIADELPADPFTTVKVMNFYKKMLWYSDDPNSTLGLAQLVTGEFFQQGGRMFLICEIPNDFPYNSSYFSFTPVQELVVPPNGTTLRMNVGEIMYPHVSGTGWPVLKATSILSNARPFITFSQPSGAFTYDSTCNANLLAQNTSGSSAWTGSSNVMSRRLKVSTGKPDMLFLTLPLQRLNGNNNMDSLFREALINELEF